LALGKDSAAAVRVETQEYPGTLKLRMKLWSTLSFK
jgi:hypothetical protein